MGTSSREPAPQSINLESGIYITQPCEIVELITPRGIDMYVTIVYVKVKPEHIADFVSACEANHKASVNEPENRRFDVLQQPDSPEDFILYEAYNSADAAAAHKETAHYLTWRDTVADWMEEPRKGVSYNGLFPA